MYKEDFAWNNPQWLICHKAQANQTNSDAEKIVGETGLFTADITSDIRRSKLRIQNNCRPGETWVLGGNSFSGHSTWIGTPQSNYATGSGKKMVRPNVL